MVDDCHDTTWSMEELLRLWGYDVRVANDGLTALEVAEQFLPHAVLLDLEMPGMDGHDLARCLRRQRSVAVALLIAVTGHARDRDFQQSRDAGCDCHLVKPVDPDGLRRLLEFYTGPHYENLNAVKDGIPVSKRSEVDDGSQDVFERSPGSSWRSGP